MKTLFLIQVFFILFLTTGNLQAQDVIYSEDFNADVGKGFDGDGLSDINGVDWILDVSACTFTGVGDYVKVVDTGDDRLEALDNDGEAVWMSSVVDISAHTDISISVFTGETGSGRSAVNKYIKLYYILDGGLEIPFFESSINWGTAIASISNLNGSNLQLVARMKTTYSSDKIYIDDITLIGLPVVVASDALSIIQNPTTQVSPQNMSSVYNGINLAQTLLRFNLSETSSTDGLATKISSISFVNIATANKADLISQFADFVVQDGSGFIAPSSVIINTHDLTLNFDSDVFSLPDNSTKEYELRAYLKSSGIVDGAKVQMQLPANGIEVFDTGSSFDVSNSVAITSPEHNILVEANVLNYTLIPTSAVIKGEEFSVSLQAVDANGNVDLDANDWVNLSILTGDGILGGDISQALSAGVVSFTNLTYDVAQDIVLKAEASGYPVTNSNTISVISSPTGDVSLPNWDAEPTISSLHTRPEDAVEAFRFSFFDLGDDAEPTVIKTIRLIAGAENTLDWQNDISGFLLQINDEFPTLDFAVSESDVLITSAGSDPLAFIQDGESIQLSLFFYLPENSTDTDVFQMAIDTSHPQWQVSGSGLLSSFTGTLTGPSIRVEVKGTELAFVDKPPKSITPNERFEMGLKAIDKFGNQNLSTAVEARVSIASGSGELSSVSGLNTSLIEGEFSWNDLMYSASENFTILIEADGMSPVLSDNISSLDANSLIVDSNAPIHSKALNPMATSCDNSEMIFSFGIKDLGSLDDSPTIINSMKFYNKFSSGGLDWKKHVAGACLISDGELIAQTSKVEKDYISFTSLDIEVANASQSDFQLGICFKKSLLPDKAQIQVEIRKEHGWKASSTASNLMEELTDDISSAIHDLDVLADRFSFISVPLGVNPSESFFVEIAAVDAHQNIDVDNNSSVNLILQDHDANLSHSGMVGSLSNGILVFDDISYSGSDLFELAVSGDLKACSELIFVQADNVIFSDNFETIDLSKWENISDWKVSSYQPIKGGSSLKHNLSNAIGNTYISCPLVDVNLKSESLFWEFNLKNSDWDPTSSNYFVFHLLMDNTDPDLAANLFSVGVNLTGTDDLLSLWKTKNRDSERLIKSDFDWNEDETLAVKVEYTARGEWKLDYNRLGVMKNWFSAGTIISEVPDSEEAWYSGLEFHFGTASRAGELWFDNLKITSYNTAPFLKSHAIFSDSIVLNFSEKLSLLESSKLDNFQLELEDKLISIKEAKTGSRNDQFILVVQNELLTGQYHLSISGMIDLHGAISQTEEIEFEFFAEAKAHDLVINEIFADETPIVGLPEYEFIEIYNASDYPINIKNYKLKVGRYDKTLSDFEIQAHDYLILCSSAASEFYTAFGNSLGLSPFPSLTNSGTSISLESASGIVLDEVTYSSSWYGDEKKKNGGWSLERIDVTNHSWQADNWQASLAITGGTPGTINSIEGHNPDIISPRVMSFEVSNSNSIDLFFSETIQLSQALDIQNYLFNQDIGHPSSIIEIENELFAVRLFFSSDFEHNTQYQLSLSDQLVDLAGNAIEEREYDFSIADLPQEGDLLINEVLFNPYAGGADYVELLNISDRMIDVRDIFIANRDNDYQLDAIYQLSTKSKMLEAGAYLLLSTDTLNVKENYSHFDENAFMQIKKMPSYNDDEGRVVILNRNHDLIDDFAYNENMHFQGITSTEGVSLERINPTKETNLASNWISAAQSIGFGTPGMKNSSYDIDEIEVNVVGFKTKTFSPDNDGVDDRLIINFELEKSGYLANIRVYNSFGREVRRLASNMTLSTKDELFWDGLLASKERAPIGIYVFYFELYHPDGDVKTYKKACVLGGKLK